MATQLEQVQLGARNTTWAFCRSDEGPPGPAPLSSEQQEAALEGQQLGPGEALDTVPGPGEDSDTGAGA